jgi:thermitase
MKNQALLTLLVTLLLAGFYVLLSDAPVASNPASPTPTTQAPSFATAPELAPYSAETTAATPASPPVMQDFKTRIGTVVAAPNGERIVLKKYTVADTPNDPFASQWWHTAYSIQSAWDVTPTANQTVLAIIDTGIAMQHEEFTNRMYENINETGVAAVELPSELNCTDQNIPLRASCNLIDDNVDGVVDNEAGATIYENPSLLNCTDKGIALQKSCNRIDDDANGYVDDVTGWDFVNSDPSPQAGQLNANGNSLRHGSMVAGIAAATANNGVGTAGIDTDTKILPLQAIDDDGYGDSLTVGNAILYAANQGADVINLSLGTTEPDTYILAAIEYAYSKGSVVVAAAGNDGCNCMIYPANYDITLSVGAADENGNRASFSSYGTSLDIMAPGTAITSSSFTPDNPTNSYGIGSGTSFAAPVVSGLLTKIKAQLPTASPTQLIALITEKTTQNSTGISYKSVEKGYGDVSFPTVINRSVTPRNFTQLTSFASITNGGLFSSTNFPVYVYACDSGNIGTTPVYKATKSASNFFSINPVDIRKSGSNGYTLQKLFTACVAQPHDTFESIRALNTAQEFTNTSIKSLLVP